MRSSTRWSSTACSSGIGSSSCAWNRTAASSSCFVLDRRQLDHAHGDLLAGDAEAHALRQLVLAEEGREPLGEAVDVDDLALVEETRAEAGRRGAHERAASRPW